MCGVSKSILVTLDGVLAGSKFFQGVLFSPGDFVPAAGVEKEAGGLLAGEGGEISKVR